MTSLVDVLKGLQSTGIGNTGIAGLICWLIYKLVDKWAPLFLARQEATATAMLKLAASVTESQEDQKNTLIAVRVLATEIGDLKRMFEEQRGK